MIPGCTPPSVMSTKETELRLADGISAVRAMIATHYSSTGTPSHISRSASTFLGFALNDEHLFLLAQRPQSSSRVSFRCIGGRFCILKFFPYGARNC
jgi:hypothetical protein